MFSALFYQKSTQSKIAFVDFLELGIATVRACEDTKEKIANVAAPKYHFG